MFCFKQDDVNNNDSTEIFITVENMQDTPPFFVRAPYSAKIDENSPVVSINHIHLSIG